MKRAKCVCTIGPASGRADILSSMIRNGMDVARLNFAHGAHEEHKKYIKMIRQQSLALNKPVAVLQDLQGIKIRIGKVENGRIRLKTGSTVMLRKGKGLSTPACLYIDYPGLVRDLRKGDRVLIDDGLKLLRVTGRNKDEVSARVIEGGEITDKKGVNLPDTELKLSSFTPKDRKDLDLGIRMGVDYVAVSFVRRAKDVQEVKDYIERKGAKIPVIAKIEKPEALDHIDAILSAADGIMIARGDLGVEMNTEDVPMIQKKLIRMANQAGKIVITATQMLESMTGHLRPTRAEVTDVANAVLDGSDALMLSAETSSGRYPRQAVKMMARIIRKTETSLAIKGAWAEQGTRKTDEPYAVADAAVRAAQDIKARAIVAFTHSGYTARLVSKFRPSVPILAFATNDRVQRRLSLYWGVTPLMMRPHRHTDDMISEVEKRLLEMGEVKKGDTVVIIASSPLSTSGRTNLMKLHRITDHLQKSG